jgi:hypothetical protein
MVNKKQLVSTIEPGQDTNLILLFNILEFFDEQIKFDISYETHNHKELFMIKLKVPLSPLSFYLT